jgi:Flp pilus assembly protein TadD
MAQDSLTLPADLAGRIEAAGLEFMARFLEVAIERRPDLTEALAELGHVYTLLGRHDEGLEVDRRLAQLHPSNPTVHYNLACSLALLLKKDAALDALEKAADLGYDDADFMIQDDDLSAVREEERFRTLVRRINRR